MTNASRQTYETALERVRGSFDLCVYGYVVMPEHVHLLLGEPHRKTLADALKSLKQGVSVSKDAWRLNLSGPQESANELGEALCGCRTAPLKPKEGLNGPPSRPGPAGQQNTCEHHKYNKAPSLPMTSRAQSFRYSLG